jgi:hypothetical protein
MTPTFTNLDVGLPGGTLNPEFADTLVTVEVGAREVARVEYSFPGFHGKWHHVLGSRGRRITWRLVIRCDSLARLVAIDQAIDAAGLAGEGVLTDATGRAFPRTVLIAHQPAGSYEVIRSGARTGWVRRESVITFETMAE